MDATVMFDKETTRSKGFAFATFQDENAVQNAMNASGIELQGKQVRHITLCWLTTRSRSSELSLEVQATCPTSLAGAPTDKAGLATMQVDSVVAGLIPTPWP